MIHYDAHQTFRGLPLTTEQEAEVRHYLNRQRRLECDVNCPNCDACDALANLSAAGTDVELVQLSS